jgi:WD40 repeat protein
LEDGEIRLPWPRLSLWNPRTGIRRALPASWSHAAFTPDDRAVIGLATDQSGEHATIQLADAATGWVERSIPLPWAPLAAEARVDISPDRRLLLAHTSARDLRMWDLTTGQVTGTWGASVVGDTSRTRVTFAPDGRTVAVVAWKYPPPPKRPPHPGPVIELTGSPSGVPEALPLYLLDTPGLRLRKAVPLPAPFLPVRIAFSPDGRRLAILLQAWPLRAGTHDTYFDVPQPRVQLVDVATGTVAEMLILPPCDPGPLAFSADGQRLATGGHGQILVWDVR